MRSASCSPKRRPRTLLAATAAPYATGPTGMRRATASRLQFVVDHVQRRSAEGELAWELPSVVDQALVVAGLKVKLGP